MSNEDNLKNSIQYLILLCIIPIGFIGFGLHIFWISPKKICDCSYSQGTLAEKNSYYKTISLNIEDKPISFNIPCSEYSSDNYFRGFNDELFDTMNTILSSDSTEHYIQIWFQCFKEGGKGIGTIFSYDYYQIIIDGIIIKTFNKWDNKKMAIGALIIGVTLLFLFIMLIIKERRKLKQEVFASHQPKKLKQGYDT